MTRKLITLAPETSVQDAARHMLEQGVHRVLVVADGKLEGIVSNTDLVRALAENEVLNRATFTKADVRQKDSGFDYEPSCYC